MSACIQSTIKLLLYTLVTALDEHGAAYATSVQHCIVTLHAHGHVHNNIVQSDPGAR